MLEQGQGACCWGGSVRMMSGFASRAISSQLSAVLLVSYRAEEDFDRGCQL